jgi:hypothetical protein
MIYIGRLRDRFTAALLSYDLEGRSSMGIPIRARLPIQAHDQLSKGSRPTSVDTDQPLKSPTR